MPGLNRGGRAKPALRPSPAPRRHRVVQPASWARVPLRGPESRRGLIAQRDDSAWSHPHCCRRMSGSAGADRAWAKSGNEIRSLAPRLQARCAADTRDHSLAPRPRLERSNHRSFHDRRAEHNTILAHVEWSLAELFFHNAAARHDSPLGARMKFFFSTFAGRSARSLCKKIFVLAPARNRSRRFPSRSRAELPHHRDPRRKSLESRAAIQLERRPIPHVHRAGDRRFAPPRQPSQPVAQQVGRDPAPPRRRRHARYTSSTVPGPASPLKRRHPTACSPSISRHHRLGSYTPTARCDAITSSIERIPHRSGQSSVST